METSQNHSHQPGHKLSCLAHVPIFNQLDRATTDQVAASIRPAHYKKGELVQPAGSNQPRLLVLSRGRAKVIRTSSDGKEQIVSWLAPGDFTGEISVFTGQPSDSEIVALEDSSFCTIDSQRLKQILSSSHQLSLAVIQELSHRLSQSQIHLESVSLLTADQKVARRLLELADERQEFNLPMSKKDLASELGITPETLSRKLKALASSRAIELEGHRTIKLIDRNQLESLS